MRMHDCISLLRSQIEIFEKEATSRAPPDDEPYVQLCLELNNVLAKSQGWMGVLDDHSADAYYDISPYQWRGG